MEASYLRTEYVKYGGKYQVFKYRGKEYRIPYNKYGHYNGIYHSIKGEHIANQIEIDEMLNLKPQSTEDAQKGFELFWSFCDD